MRLSRSLAGITALAAAANLAHAQDPHFNEIYASMTGTDEFEYIELVGTPGMALDDYYVCVVEGEGGGQGILDRVWKLAGHAIPADGYFVMSSTMTATMDYDLDQGPHAVAAGGSFGTANHLENGTETFYLLHVTDALAQFDLENSYYNGTIDGDMDLITLFDTDANITIVEAVGMVNDDWVNGLDNVHDCAPPLGPEGTFFPAGVFRPGDYPNDWCSDTWLVFADALDAMNTPGTPNPASACTTLPSSSGCSGGGNIGMSYCGPSVANSTGSGALITAQGSETASDMNLMLTASQLPPNQFAYFIGGMTQGFVMGPGGSQGNLCLAGQIARFNSQIFSSGANGEGSIVVDTQNMPNPPGGAILAGQTWSFQCWYRDVNPNTTSNFTDGVEISFN
jgi:hypothetical protein